MLYTYYRVCFILQKFFISYGKIKIILGKYRYDEYEDGSYIAIPEGTTFLLFEMFYTQFATIFLTYFWMHLKISFIELFFFILLLGATYSLSNISEEACLLHFFTKTIRTNSRSNLQSVNGTRAEFIKDINTKDWYNRTFYRKLLNLEEKTATGSEERGHLDMEFLPIKQDFMAGK